MRAHPAPWRVACAVGLVAAALALGACARPHAQTEPTMPPLAAPPPPAHEVAPEPAAARPAATSPDRSAPASRSPERHHRPAPAEEPQPAASSPGTGSNAGSPPPMTLETAPAADAEAETQAINRKIAEARRDLQGVDYRSLSADGRAQYDTAKRFISQAEAALQKRNFTFARSLADKAAVLAALLHGGI